MTDEEKLKDRALEVLIWMFQESKYKDVLGKLYDVEWGQSITQVLKKRMKSKEY